MTEHGRSAADAASGCQPTASAASSTASSQSGIPSAWPLMGYAPGSYMGKCHVCGETQDNVDKRAWQCLECAAREAKRVIEMLSGRELELLRKVENYGNLIVYLASDTHDVKPDAIRTLARNALAASGIETEGHDGETRHGAEHESPTGEAGDAQ